MKNDRFKAKLAALDALGRNLDRETAAPALRKALADQSNVLVAKAAAIVGQQYLAELSPDIVAAFYRLLSDVGDDAGCRGKNALAKALKDLDHHDPVPFVRGLAHVQLEPVWGGKADTAGSLRATCAQALVACDIDATLLLELLTDHLVDSDKAVRLDVAIAIAQLGRPESALLLRLKALCGDSEAEVIGQCLLSLLDLTPVDAITFAARFLASKHDDLRFEAVNVLAQARSPEAVDHLRRFWDGEVSFDLRRATVTALAASPVTQAADFLVKLVAHRLDDIAVSAIAALAASRFRSDVRDRVESDVARSGSQTLQAAFDEHFGFE